MKKEKYVEVTDGVLVVEWTPEQLNNVIKYQQLRTEDNQLRDKAKLQGDKLCQVDALRVNTLYELLEQLCNSVALPDEPMNWYQVV